MRWVEWVLLYLTGRKICGCRYRQERFGWGRRYDEDSWEGGDWSESPVHEVELSEYWIGKYPVIVCQYKIGHPTPVGIFPESCSLEGVSDMPGNVWEWCEDWYGDYPKSSVFDPTGLENGSVRVVRGGGWESFAADCRSALRWSTSGSRGNIVGFRLCFSRS